MTTAFAARLIARNAAANARRIPLAGESAREQHAAAARREARALAHYVAAAKAAAR